MSCGQDDDPNNLKGILKGDVLLYAESNEEIASHENILVEVQGTEPLIQTFTDKEGYYVIDEIPQGTYNIIFRKDGFSQYEQQGFRVVGGSKPLYLSKSLFEKSTTSISQLSLIKNEKGEYFLQGLINHSYAIADLFNLPTIQFYIHSDPNPSSEKYLQTGGIQVSVPSGSFFTVEIDLDTSLSSSFYITAYGRHHFEDPYYDIQSDQLRYTSLGRASNVYHFKNQ